MAMNLQVFPLDSFSMMKLQPCQSARMVDHCQKLHKHFVSHLSNTKRTVLRTKERNSRAGKLPQKIVDAM